MPKGDRLGEFERLILLAIAGLGVRAYGMSILRRIEDSGGRETAIGAVYAALERLERKGMIVSRLGEPTPERGGRAKRFVELSVRGVEALSESARAQAALESLVRPKLALGDA